MRLATPRSTPRDAPNHHYLWVIVGMLYVSQGSAGELRGGGARAARDGGLCVGVSGWAREDGWRAQDGWRCCGCESLYRKNQPQWKLKPRRSLTHHAHSRAYRSLALSLSLSILLPPLSRLRLALSRFYPISFPRNLRSPPSRTPFRRFLHSIPGSTQLQRNRRAILGDKVTS
jgi:hypothetical protein